MKDTSAASVFPIPLAFFALPLLIGESFLASVLIGGNLQPQQKLLCVWCGIAMFVLVIAAVTVLIWLKPTHLAPGTRLVAESIIDIPASELDTMWGNFLSEGAEVTAIRQADGRYTLEALFLVRRTGSANI